MRYTGCGFFGPMYACVDLRYPLTKSLKPLIEPGNFTRLGIFTFLNLITSDVACERHAIRDVWMKNFQPLIKASSIKKIGFFKQKVLNLPPKLDACIHVSDFRLTCLYLCVSHSSIQKLS